MPACLPVAALAGCQNSSEPPASQGPVVANDCPRCPRWLRERQAKERLLAEVSRQAAERFRGGR